MSLKLLVEDENIRSVWSDEKIVTLLELTHNANINTMLSFYFFALLYCFPHYLKSDRNFCYAVFFCSLQMNLTRELVSPNVYLIAAELLILTKRDNVWKCARISIFFSLISENLFLCHILM